MLNHREGFFPTGGSNHCFIRKVKLLVLRCGWVWAHHFWWPIREVCFPTFLRGVESWVIPRDVFPVWIADDVGDDGRLFKSPVVWPVAADSSLLLPLFVSSWPIIFQHQWFTPEEGLGDDSYGISKVGNQSWRWEVALARRMWRSSATAYEDDGWNFLDEGRCVM